MKKLSIITINKNDAEGLKRTLESIWDKQVFKETIEQVANYTGKAAIVIEKDYYVTMILKLLSEEVPDCVFKGGI